MTRPRRIDQVIPSIVEHDAVSNHTFEAQRLLRELGFESEIYASILGPGTEGRVRPVSELAAGAGPDRWLLYQCSIGSPVADAFLADPGGKLLDYHNITPAPLVERWIPPLAAEARLGREQLARLAPSVPFAVADSAYNAEELSSLGFPVARVAPLLIDQSNLSVAADHDTAGRLQEAKRAGGADWLFVGQIAPHKAQHELVSALACYRQAYSEPDRLHIVGREMGNAYRDAVVRYVRALDLAGSVDLPGSVRAEVLAAYYENADVFVCLSYHEGFNAPIVEAMHRGLPVVAVEAAALPGTIGDAGLLLKRREPTYVAAAIHELLGDRSAVQELARRGRERAREFDLETTRAIFRSLITEAVEATPA